MTSTSYDQMNNNNLRRNNMNNKIHTTQNQYQSRPQSNSPGEDQYWRKQNAVLVSEAKRNGVDSAIEMLWRLNRDGEVVTQNFNQVVSLLAGNGRFEDGLKLAEEASEKGLSNIITFRPLMKLCCSLGDGNGSKRVYKCMSKYNIEGDMFIYAELMGALVRSQDMASANFILKSLKDNGKQPHIILYNTLMKEFARRADVKSGFKTLETIELNDIKPDETTFNTLLNTCVRAMDIEAVQQAIASMNKHNVRPGTPTFNTILKLYSRKGKFDKALSIFEEMQQIVQPSIVTYNTLIDGCAHRGDMERASIFFERMVQNGFFPDICTLTSLLKGFGRSNDPKRAVELFDAMSSGGFKIEDRTRYAVVNACLRGGDVKNSRRYLRDMKESNMVVRTKTWIWMLESDVLTQEENGALETLGLMYANGACLDAGTKAVLVRDIREKGIMPQFLRQLKAARTGEPRN